jgi:dTDP-4-amino-4,6-dideoxygalactose transaminase
VIVEKRAVEPARYRRPAFFYPSARAGFRDFLANMPGRDGRGVLLPSFIGWSPREGSGVFDPLRDLALPAEFYRLNRDLTVDVEDLARRVDGRRHLAVVLIHYYGRTEPQATAVRDLAAARGVPLVEDLAHGFFSAMTGDVAGCFGQVSLYSLHKMLPVPDGGMVVYADPSLVRDQRSTRPDLAGAVLSYDWHRIAAARRRNFLRATALLRQVRSRRGDLELVWPDLADGDVPQTLPVYVRGGGRDAIYERMNAAGFGVVSLYHTLIPEVGDAFPGSAWAAGHVINLPVHQDVRPESLAAVVSAFEACVAEVNGGGGI